MVRYDILAGIKNAVERGYSIEKARQSLINAGYSVNEVNEAINYITGGVSSRMSLPQSQQPENKNQQQTSQKNNSNMSMNKPMMNNQQKQEDNKKDMNENTKNNEKDHHDNMISNTSYQKAFEKQKTHGHFPWKIVILVIILLILIGALGAVILFKDTIISYLNSVLG